MVIATQHIRRMNGGAQAHLMRCDDGANYVVKFQNNSQHIRILANEMLATRLAELMGIAVPHVSIVEVRSTLIENTPELAIELAQRRLPCSVGLQFGSKYPDLPSRRRVYNSLPDEYFQSIKNREDFLGIYIFDKWTCNTDSRQAVFIPQSETGLSSQCRDTFQAIMIDQGFCFDGGNWDFPDAPLRSLYSNRRVYHGVTGLESFEPWLYWLEECLTYQAACNLAQEVPSEWYENDDGAWRQLIERLYKRRTRLRELIWAARKASPQVFPNWQECASPKYAPRLRSVKSALA